MTHAEKLAIYLRNNPRHHAFYVTLPLRNSSRGVRCPAPQKGKEARPEDIWGCGSKNIAYDGDVYDCFDCSIFFGDYAADPPHQRTGCHDYPNEDTDEEAQQRAAQGA